MLNRRDFLKSLFAIGALTTLKPVDEVIEEILNETESLYDNEFITYIHFTMNLYVHNPSKSAIITGIKE